MTEKKQALGIQLNGQIKSRFLEIKRTKGLTDDEALTLIINEYFEKKLIKGVNPR